MVVSMMLESYEDMHLRQIKQPPASKQGMEREGHVEDVLNSSGVFQDPDHDACSHHWSPPPGLELELT